MTTIADVYDVIRTRLEANFSAIPLRWQNEDGEPLSDQAVAFAYVEIVTDTPEPASYGGGRGNNRYRQTGRIEAHVFIPVGQGLVPVLTYAEQIAAVFRSYRDATISCFGAGVQFDGSKSDDGNYYVAHAVTDFHFDQIG